MDCNYIIQVAFSFVHHVHQFYSPFVFADRNARFRFIQKSSAERLSFLKTPSLSSFNNTIMNVRKIIESYEHELSPTPTSPPSHPGSLRPRPRPRPLASQNTSFLVTSNQRSIRPQRPPSLKIVKEEGPAAVLRVCRTSPLRERPLI